MRTSWYVKRWIGIVMLAVGLCVICVAETRPTPEQVAARTNLLFEAIDSNDLDQAKLCIESGANINAKKRGSGITPLIYAIQKNRDEMVDLLIKSGVNVNTKDTGDDGRPPLVWVILAARQVTKRVSMVDMLIKAKADLSAKDNRGYTGLRYAVWNGYIPEFLTITELLIKAGCDVNEKKSGDGQTLLMTALYNSRCKDVVDMLIKYGADVNAKADDGNTALMVAACHAGVESVDMLIKAGADVNARANNGTTALKEAFSYESSFGGRRDVIARLRAAGATE